MPALKKTIDPLLAACAKDIRWEFRQLRSRIQLDEVYRLAGALLNKKPIEWPRALFELQQGIITKRLLQHLNFHVRKFGFPLAELSFTGEFPAFSLKPLLAKTNEYRAVIRTARCIEFLGNKIWDQALKPVKKSGIPCKIEIATLTLNTFDCSHKQQIEAALTELVRYIQGHLINFFYMWETLLIRQTEEQLLVYKADLSLPVSAAAV
ncbi:hypothetical protein [Sporomusa aerivorans]|uniref:hypothetical protein n=1 Tax=Sporomusa aerivorans TaxID=204936 RepID=UPI00352BA4CA